MHLAHTPPASTTELLDVLALFPNFGACGARLSIAEPVIADPQHAFRMRHAGPCPTTPRAA